MMGMTAMEEAERLLAQLESALAWQSVTSEAEARALLPKWNEAESAFRKNAPRLLRTLLSEVRELRQTNTRLNRRCQSAEAAADTKAEDWNKRAAGDKLRNHYYIRTKEAEAEVRELRAQQARYESAIRWALGEEGEFSGEEPPPLAGRYRRRFWWREELRRRAALSPQTATEERQ